MKSNVTLPEFAKRFLTGRMNWYNIPRMGITNFGNIISMVLYRVGQFQVELFIVPHQKSSFTVHRHPHVDAVEFPLAGNSWLNINGQAMWTDEQVQQWLDGSLPTLPVPIGHNDWHEGGGSTPYAFLSIQEWLDGVVPSSVGIDWEGEASSDEQVKIWRDISSERVSV